MYCAQWFSTNSHALFRLLGLEFIHSLVEFNNCMCAGRKEILNSCLVSVIAHSFLKIGHSLFMKQLTPPITVFLVCVIFKQLSHYVTTLSQT